MKNLKLALKIILGASISTVLVVFISLLTFSYIETDKNYYSTYSDAKDDRLFGRGWTPYYIPTSSKEITEVHDVSSNKVCAKLNIPVSDSDGFIEILKEKGFNKVNDSYDHPPKFAMYVINMCPFDSNDITKSKSVIYTSVTETLSVTNYVIGRHNNYFALDKSSGTVYYWSLPKRI